MPQSSEVEGQSDLLLWQLVEPGAWLSAIVGLILVTGVLIPADFGNPDWEFGAINSFLDGMPLVLIGLGLLAATAAARGRRVRAIGVGLVFVALAVAVVLAGLLLAIDLPLAWRAGANNAILQTALKKSLAKAGIQVVVTPVVAIVLAWKCLRRSH